MDQLSTAHVPLANARALPGACYTSDAFFQSEMTHIHRRNWFFAGREDELAPGGWRAIDTVGGPAVLVRDRAGTLRAFANVCPHRGSVVCEGHGNTRVLLCPYHAWSFAHDGTLLAAPGMDNIQGFDRSAHGLAPVRLDTWAGFIFLNYDDTAPSLREHLGDLPDTLASHRAEDMVVTWRHDIEVRCNWKLLVENALEAYHTGTVHARTVGAQTETFPPTSGNWLNLQVLSTASIAVLDGAPPFPAIPSLSDAAKRGTYFTMVLPGTQFACAQDCIWWLSMRPIAADRTALSLGGCFPRATTKLPNFGLEAERYYTRWRLVAEEDVGILEKQQIALGSIRYRPGPLSWRDTLAHAVHCWVLARVPMPHQ